MLFFSVVYFGMKYNWVNGSPSTSRSKSDTTLQIPQTNNQDNVTTSNNSTQENAISPDSNIKKPELIDEAELSSERLLGDSTLTIEEVVSQCQSRSAAVGIPDEKLEQAIIECVDRNSSHLLTDSSEHSDGSKLIREQCNMAITQKELLSDDEIKMLVDECVASMSTE